MKITIITLFSIALLSTNVIAGLVAWGLCQSACNAGYGVCSSAAGAIAGMSNSETPSSFSYISPLNMSYQLMRTGTFTAGIGIPVALAGCWYIQGTCTTIACFPFLAAPIP